MNLWTASIILALAHLAAGLLFLRIRTTGRHLRYFVAFSAGTLLAISLGHLLPESVAALGEGSGLPVLAGFFALWAVEHLVGSHDHTDEVHDHAHDHSHGHEHGAEGGLTGLSVLASLVLLLHGLVDGMALAAVGSDAGWDSAILIGLAAHAPALMLALVTVLRLSGLEDIRAVGIVVAASAIIPAGAFLATTGMAVPEYLWIPRSEAFIAGALIYLATHHLLPAVEHRRADRMAIYGIALAGAAATLLLADLH